MAAAVALLATLTYFLLPKYGPEHFQAQYPGLIENVGGLRSPEADSGLQDRALKAYEANDFKKCITLLAPSPSTSQQRILLGSAYLMQGQDSAAIPVLEPVLNDPKQLEYARWLLALAHLHMGQEDQARPYLDAIVSDPARLYKKSEAGSILNKLNRFWR